MNFRLLFAFLSFLTCCVPVADARLSHLLPRVQRVVTADSLAPFKFGRHVALIDSTSCHLLADLLEAGECSLDLDARAVVKTELVDSIPGAFNHRLYGWPDEAYSITVRPDTLLIKALNATGVIRAAQTLWQMAEGWNGDPALESCDITDWPAFKLRGFMHDCGRSYIAVEEIKKHLKLLSHFKINTFHWHLTENQAWRFEVKKYPRLTSAESMTRDAGKFYTQQECRDVAALARELGITVIPEIDMPGHSAAFERAMGFSMQSRQGRKVLGDVLDELCDVFPDAPYIHIGADEADRVEPDFLREMTELLHRRGKRVICWNPIHGVNISPDLGIDMTQMWGSAGKKVAGIPNIDCRYNYINHFDVFADVVGIFRSSVYYAPRGTDEVAGAITAIWNDRHPKSDADIVGQNNMYTCILAMAERTWAGGGSEYIETGGVMIPENGDDAAEFADWERRFLFHKFNSLVGEPIPYVKQTHMKWRVSDGFPNGGDAAKVFPPEWEIRESYDYGGKRYVWSDATGAGIYLRHTWGKTVPALMEDISVNRTAYAHTYIYSPADVTAGALIEFQNYSRSEKDLAPDNGTWDRKGSRIWLNGAELLPTHKWLNAGKEIDSETLLLNENFTGRKPQIIKLRKGWNEVLIKLPYVETPGVRLNKWMFTFAITDIEGKSALAGLVYSPDRKL